MTHTEIAELLSRSPIEAVKRYTIDNGECSITFDHDPTPYVKEHVYHTLDLSDESLSRDDYIDVQKIIKALKGKWDRATQTHIFPVGTNPVAYIAEYAKHGAEALNPYAFFETPRNVIHDMLDIANIQPNHLVLEPSAGAGAIAKLVQQTYQCNGNLHCVERCEYRQTFLRDAGLNIVASDFLTYNPDGIKYDRILMNPPFSVKKNGSIFIDHVIHALELLAPGGVLVAITPLTWLWSDKPKHEMFRKFFLECGSDVKLYSRGTFKSSGTNIAALCVTFIKD